jgi:hypothetical protein
MSGLLASGVSPVPYRESTMELPKPNTKSTPTLETWNGSSGHVSDIDQLVSKEELIHYLEESFHCEVDMRTKVYVNTVVVNSGTKKMLRVDELEQQYDHAWQVEEEDHAWQVTFWRCNREGHCESRSLRWLTWAISPTALVQYPLWTQKWRKKHFVFRPARWNHTWKSPFVVYIGTETATTGITIMPSS